MKRWHIGGAVVALAAAHLSSPASASGDPLPTPTYIHPRGGTPAEQQRLFGGRLGIVLPDAPQGMLFLQWRLLHGLEVGPAGPPLVARYHWVPEGPDEGVTGWMAARALVTGGTASQDYMRLDKKGAEEYQYTPNCVEDALNTANATLRARVKQHGAADPGVRAWLDAQDVVFRQCSEMEEVAMPPLPADAPAWLKYDRAYQEAAWSLYAGRHREAARRFAAIGRDTGSPWHGMGFYLTARALYREVVDKPAEGSTQLAREAIDRLAAAPAGTYGQGEAVGMRRAIDFRERPEWLFNDLERVLSAPKATPDLAVAFKDYQWLGLQLKDKPRPEIADWIGTLQTYFPYEYEDDAKPLVLDWAPHARERWAKTHDVAWLIAALALTHPGDPAAAGLAADAAKVPETHPGWLTAQYHLMRITIGTVPAAETRARVDRLLATPGLPQSERNIFLSIRAQVATGLPDFIAHTLRKPFCMATKPGFCVADDSAESDVTLGKGAQGWVGFGEESRAIIDRMPLDMRIAVSRSASIPRDMRLDIALTNFPRAVLLQDNALIDQVSRDLVTLLPQMASDWKAVLAARPGEAKRFATWLAMAKIPGLRVDLADYYRPSGTLRQFHGYWVEWMMVPKGAVNAPHFAEIGEYNGDGRYTEGTDDPTCRGKCGSGAFPLHLPQFVADKQAQVTRERQTFAFYEPNRWGDPDKQPVFPAGTTSMWEALFAYAKANPRNPRSPEALYWLSRVSRWGANPDHLNERAFRLMHRNYPGSSWAKRVPIYWD